MGEPNINLSTNGFNVRGVGDSGRTTEGVQSRPRNEVTAEKVGCLSLFQKVKSKASSAVSTVTAYISKKDVPPVLTADPAPSPASVAKQTQSVRNEITNRRSQVTQAVIEFLDDLKKSTPLSKSTSIEKPTTPKIPGSVKAMKEHTKSQEDLVKNLEAAAAFWEGECFSDPNNSIAKTFLETTKNLLSYAEDAVPLFRGLEALMEQGQISQKEVMNHLIKHFADPSFKAFVDGVRELTILSSSQAYPLKDVPADAQPVLVIKRLALHEVTMKELEEHFAKEKQLTTQDPDEHVEQPTFQSKLVPIIKQPMLEMNAQVKTFERTIKEFDMKLDMMKLFLTDDSILRGQQDIQDFAKVSSPATQAIIQNHIKTSIKEFEDSIDQAKQKVADAEQEVRKAEAKLVAEQGTDKKVRRGMRIPPKPQIFFTEANLSLPEFTKVMERKIKSLKEASIVLDHRFHGTSPKLPPLPPEGPPTVRSIEEAPPIVPPRRAKTPPKTDEV